MNIEFIELEHRENILKLMEICGIEMKEAYDLYVQAGYNFEVRSDLGRQQSAESSISIIMSLKNLLFLLTNSSRLPCITQLHTFKISSWKMMTRNTLSTSNS